MDRAPRPLRTVIGLGLMSLALTGCGGAPYVITDYHSHQQGIVEVCYDRSKTPLGEAQKLADGVCDLYDRVASLQMSQSFQCNWRTPDIVLYYCVARPGETPLPLVRQSAPLRGDSPRN